MDFGEEKQKTLNQLGILLLEALLDLTDTFEETRLKVMALQRAFCYMKKNPHVVKAAEEFLKSRILEILSKYSFPRLVIDRVQKCYIRHFGETEEFKVAFSDALMNIHQQSKFQKVVDPKKDSSTTKMKPKALGTTTEFLSKPFHIRPILPVDIAYDFTVTEEDKQEFLHNKYLYQLKMEEVGTVKILLQFIPPAKKSKYRVVIAIKMFDLLDHCSQIFKHKNFVDTLRRKVIELYEEKYPELKERMLLTCQRVYGVNSIEELKVWQNPADAVSNSINKTVISQ